MTPALPLPLPRTGRHPTWYLLLLLPVLPILAPHAEPSPWVQGPSTDTLAAGGLLGIVSLALALGLPDLLQRLGHQVRKEAELLRPAWIASVFLTQAAILLTGGGLGLDLMVFTGCAALLAALPLGAEFQQRTLSGLLAQPVPRAEWWFLKLLTPACALTLHAALFLTNRLAFGFEVGPLLVLATLGLAALAWATTPWWTLVSRGLLSGLVFSLTVPLVTLVVLTLTLGALPVAETLRVGSLTYDELLFYTIAYGVAPAYAVAAFRLGRRRWMTLEARDTASGDGGVLSLPLFRRRADANSRRGPVLARLAAKEFRLQTPTLLLAVATLVAGLANLLPLESLRAQGFYLQGGFLMMAATTLLLAAATTVAEERRLGTLDSQLLLPISRGRQWLVKFGVASLIALGMGTLILSQAPPLALGLGGATLLHPLTLLLGLAALFAATLLVSSTTSNSLRALLSGAALGALAMGAGALVFGLTRWPISSLMESHFGVWNPSPEQVQIWRTTLEIVPSESLVPRLQQLERLTESFADLARPFFALPVLLAVFLARHNYLHPNLAPRRLARQFAACLGFLVLIQAALFLVEYRSSQARLQISAHHLFLRHLEWENSLTPAERELLRRGHDPMHGLDRTVGVRFRSPDGGPPRGMAPRLYLPLTPGTRALILEHGLLPEEILQQLRDDAARDPRPAPRVPPPTPARQLPMSPALMRRYGLVTDPESPPIPSTLSPSNAPTPRSAPAMSPELMKRYGLRPPEAPPTPPSPAPVP